MLLDTNVIIELFKGNTEVRSVLSGQQELFVAAIVFGELYYGAYRSGNPAKHLKEVDAFLQQCSVIDFEAAIAKRYGVVKAGLLNIGKPIPDNDIIIAATALHLNMPLYTNDKHFTHVDGLQLVQLEQPG